MIIVWSFSLRWPFVKTTLALCSYFHRCSSFGIVILASASVSSVADFFSAFKDGRVEVCAYGVLSVRLPGACASWWPGSDGPRVYNPGIQGESFNPQVPVPAVDWFEFMRRVTCALFSSVSTFSGWHEDAVDCDERSGTWA